MQEPKVGDKFQFEDKNIVYTIINVVKYHEYGEFSNKLYEGGYQIKYVNTDENSQEMKCGIKYDEDYESYINYYATKKEIAKKLITFTHKS
jgi:hypothetical protein